MASRIRKTSKKQASKVKTLIKRDNNVVRNDFVMDNVFDMESMYGGGMCEGFSGDEPPVIISFVDTCRPNYGQISDVFDHMLPAMGSETDMILKEFNKEDVANVNEHIMPLTVFLLLAPTIKTLSFQKCDLSGKALRVLMVYMANDTHIKTLTLSDNLNMGETAPMTIFHHLTSNRSLDALNLVGCGFGDECIRWLTSYLDSNSGVISAIDLTSNPDIEVIPDEYNVAFGRNSTIKTVKLGASNDRFTYPSGHSVVQTKKTPRVSHVYLGPDIKSIADHSMTVNKLVAPTENKFLSNIDSMTIQSVAALEQIAQRMNTSNNNVKSITIDSISPSYELLVDTIEKFRKVKSFTFVNNNISSILPNDTNSNKKAK